VTYLQGTLAARPAAGISGRFYFATDAAVTFYDTGAAWIFVSGVQFVTNLPASPVDGQEVYYLADSANGVVWHLRYRNPPGSPNPNAHKWEFLGGGALNFESPSVWTATGNGAYQTDPNVSPLTVPLPGWYTVDFGATVAHSAAGIQVNTRVISNPGAIASFESWGANTQTYYMPVTRRVTLGPLVTGGTLVVQHLSPSGTITSYRRYVAAQPLRVG